MRKAFPKLLQSRKRNNKDISLDSIGRICVKEMPRMLYGSPPPGKSLQKGWECGYEETLRYLADYNHALPSKAVARDVGDRPSI